MTHRIAFIGGGNMASAIIGGLIENDILPSQIDVVEPLAEARDKLQSTFGLQPRSEAGPFLTQADLVVWAVKPQTFKQATLAVAPFTANALHLSVAAGIPSTSIAHWLGTERVVRAMPNTPALIGKGITGLFARSGTTSADKDWIAQVMATTGEFLWLATEDLLDAVIAISGSGPAYLFYLMEAMTTAGTEMGRLAFQEFDIFINAVLVPKPFPLGCVTAQHGRFLIHHRTDVHNYVQEHVLPKMINAFQG